MRQLKIYTDCTLLPESDIHTYMLFPKLGNYLKSNKDPDSNRFDEFCLMADQYFKFVESPEEADYFLLPFGFSFDQVYQKKMHSFLEKAKVYQKKTLVFYNSDDDSDIDLENTILFRTSYYKSKQKINTHALPGWSVDFVNYFENKNFTTLPYQASPSVSYCGYIDYEKQTLKGIVKSIIKSEPFSYELIAKKIRGKACRTIRNNASITSNFIIRNGFWAAGIEDKNIARAEYANNIISSLYSIATRGGGNFSYRLFEILSCGRIPIFINTDSILPFDSIINWKEHMVWIEETDLHKIDQLVLDFHLCKTPQELIKIQESNRQLYIEYISPNGFFKNLNLIL